LCPSREAPSFLLLCLSSNNNPGSILSSKLKAISLILGWNMEVEMFRAILKDMSELGIDEIEKRLLFYWKWKIVR
jgi:hypothetical protein